VALLAVAGWQVEKLAREQNSITSYTAPATSTGTGATTGDNIATQTSPSSAPPSTTNSPIASAVLQKLIGSYVTLNQQGMYTPAVGQKVAENMATSLKIPISYAGHTLSEMRTVSDASYARALKYRSDLQTALAPLLKNKQPEFEIFAYYVQTKDKKYLTELGNVADNYRAAEAATLNVIVPNDARAQHLAIVDAMGEFAATLDAMIANADDPFGSAILMRSYNQAEQDMLTSFDALATYFKGKQS
jgi:hypothetical protein